MSAELAIGTRISVPESAPQITPGEIIQSRNILQRLRRSEFVKNALTSMTIGAIVGIPTRLITRETLRMAGMYALPLTMTVGAVGGGTVGFAKEYWKQRVTQQEFVPQIEQPSRLPSLDFFKAEYQRMRLMDSTKLKRAAFVGAGFGAVGAVIGYEAMEVAKQVPWEQVASKVTSFFPRPDLSALHLPSFPGFETPKAYAAAIEDYNPNEHFQPSSPAKLSVIDQFRPEEINNKPLEPIDILPKIPGSMPDILRIEKDSNIWFSMEELLKRQLHRDPTNAETAYLVNSFLKDHTDINPAKIVVGKEFNIAELHDEIRNVKAGKIPFIETKLPMPDTKPPAVGLQDLKDIPDATNLKPGSNPTTLIHDLLKEGLGREPTKAEVVIGTQRFLAVNHITDEGAKHLSSTRIFDLKDTRAFITAIKEGKIPNPIGNITTPHLPPVLHEPIIHAQPDIDKEVIALKRGGSIWRLSERELILSGNKHPSPRRIKDLASEIVRRNNIGVKVWSIAGKFSDRKLPIGFPVKIPK